MSSENHEALFRAANKIDPARPLTPDEAARFERDTEILVSRGVLRRSEQGQANLTPRPLELSRYLTLEQIAKLDALPKSEPSDNNRRPASLSSKTTAPVPASASVTGKDEHIHVRLLRATATFNRLAIWSRWICVAISAAVLITIRPLGSTLPGVVVMAIGSMWLARYAIVAGTNFLWLRPLIDDALKARGEFIQSIRDSFVRGQYATSVLTILALVASIIVGHEYDGRRDHGSICLWLAAIGVSWYIATWVAVIPFIQNANRSRH